MPGLQNVCHILRVAPFCGCLSPSDTPSKGVTHSAIAKYPHAFPGGKARENLVAGLRTVSQRAADAGVVFGLEVINRYESNVLNTAAQVGLGASGSPRVNESSACPLLLLWVFPRAGSTTLRLAEDSSSLILPALRFSRAPCSETCPLRSAP